MTRCDVCGNKGDLSFNLSIGFGQNLFNDAEIINYTKHASCIYCHKKLMGQAVTINKNSYCCQHCHILMYAPHFK